MSRLVTWTQSSGKRKDPGGKALPGFLFNLKDYRAKPKRFFELVSEVAVVVSGLNLIHFVTNQVAKVGLGFFLPKVTL